MRVVKFVAVAGVVLLAVAEVIGMVAMALIRLSDRGLNIG